MARPTTGPARSVPSSPAEREAEKIRMSLLTSAMQYHELGGTGQYLQEPAEEEESDLRGGAPAD